MKKEFKLKNTLNMSFVLAVVIPIISISLAAILFARGYILDISKDSHEQIITNLDHIIESFFKTPEKDMTLLKEAILNTGISDYDQIIPDFYRGQEFFHHIYVLDSEGKIKYTFPSDPSIKDFDYAYETSAAQILNGKANAWSDLYVFQRENLISMNFSMKCGEDILFGVIHLQVIQNLFEKNVTTDGVSIALANEYNNYMVHSHYEYVEQHFYAPNFEEDMLFEKYYNDGVPYYVTVKKTGYLNWKIMIFEEVKNVNERLMTLILFLGGATCVIVLLAVTVGFKLNGLVFSNLHMLLTKTKEVKDGKYVISIDHSRFVEFNELRKNFLMMLDEIKMREDQILSQNYEIETMNRALEERVNERTNDLYQANHELEVALENLKVTQDQLIESEKLASLGELVTGLAHEINTPLGIILTIITYLQESTKHVKSTYDKGLLKKSDFETYINAHVDSEHLIYENISKAIELISSFKLISAEQRNIEKRKVEIKEFIESVVRSIDPKLKKSNIKIHMHVDEAIEIVTIPIALYQIIVNLLMNVKVHAYDEEGGMIDLFVNKNKHYLEIIVQDYGHGIEEQNLKKIFDPFFTTKRGAGGTGLGLNIVYNTVKQNLNGEIKCYSEINVGSQFVVHLPYDL
ncbi:MAG: hypothetical protein JXR88_12005 [Clostridia bacterium]|nr:hypothetical protein [Clostridia bacterium]